MSITGPRAGLGRLQRWMRSQATLGLNDDLQAFRLGQVLAGQQRISEPASVEQAEFRVYSQAGEDGVINWLVSQERQPKTFVEIGVESYREANTRFLLMYRHWSGIAIDAADDHVDFIRTSALGWQYSIDPVCKYITAENALQAVREAIWFDRIGLLSLDIDGVDYWVLAELAKMQPAIIVCEYNAAFGCDLAVTVPYRPDFDRFKAHHSGLYFGASLRAFTTLLEPLGYRLVGCGSNGVNAYFVSADVHPGAPAALAVSEAYRPAQVRQGRDTNGDLTHQRADVELRTLPPLPLVDVATMETLTLREIRG